MRSYRKILSTSICVFFFLAMRGYSVEVGTHELPQGKPGAPTPWFTGPIIAPSSVAVPPGHVTIEPYVFATVTGGLYTKHWHTISLPNVYNNKSKSLPNFYSYTLQTIIQAGIVPGIDCRIDPQLFYNTCGGAKSFEFGDFPIGMGFQLLHEDSERWVPNIKFAIRAYIPSGKYQHLNPNKNGTDGVGTGSWNPSAVLIFGKIFHTSGVHFISSRLEARYTVGTPVHVKGLNVYGGAKGTHGTVYPGNVLFIDLAGEYSLTQNWALALDTIYIHENKTRFSGKTPLKAPVGYSSLEQFSLAPAIEYNFNVNIGIIAGAWFTVAGRNAYQFASGTIAINIYI